MKAYSKEEQARFAQDTPTSPPPDARIDDVPPPPGMPRGLAGGGLRRRVAPSERSASSQVSTGGLSSPAMSTLIGLHRTNALGVALLAKACLLTLVCARGVDA
jgi:hypothetical protein